MTHGDAQLRRLAPYFPVRHVELAVQYYETVLGFEVEYVGGVPPGFAIVRRDGLPIMFRAVGDADVRPNEKQGGTWDAFFWVLGLEELADEYRRAGAEFVYGPLVQSEYEMVEFAIRDPFGYVLGFGEPVGAAPPTDV